jgi:hypothetical protein
MEKLVSWVKNHQLVAFFVLTFLITWGLGFSYRAVMKRGQILPAPLVFIATCGPALAGIIFAFVVVIVLADRIWKRLPLDHPTVVKTRAMSAERS